MVVPKSVTVTFKSELVAAAPLNRSFAIKLVAKSPVLFCTIVYVSKVATIACGVTVNATSLVVNSGSQARAGLVILAKYTWPLSVLLKLDTVSVLVSTPL